MRHWRRYKAALLRARACCWRPSLKPWAAPGQCVQHRPKLLVWDNAPPHHPERVQAAAAAGRISIAWLPFRSPELNSDEDLWRMVEAQVAAHRPFPAEQPDHIVQVLAEQAVRCIAALSPLDRLRCPGSLSAKFQWLSQWLST
jgi:hypothetical protein